MAHSNLNLNDGSYRTIDDTSDENRFNIRKLLLSLVIIVSFVGAVYIAGLKNITSSNYVQKTNSHDHNSLNNAFIELSRRETELSVQSTKNLYNDFTAVYNKEASTTRFNIFHANLVAASVHNNADNSWTMGINAHSDLTDAEFMQLYSLGTDRSTWQNCSATSGFYQRRLSTSDIPQSFDWRKYSDNNGKVRDMTTSVKSQGGCGSCWTFSTAGGLESHYKIHKQSEGDADLDLAEQQLLDCASDFDNKGCNGGLPSHAFEYLMYAGGMMSESSYPYKSSTGVCQFDISKVVAKVPGGANNITALDEDALTEAIFRHGPVSVAFQVDNSFRAYAGGVFNSVSCKSGTQDVNHAVLAVGYGVDPNNIPYYIIKNSWGSGWGENGYFRMRRGANMCGVGQCASFPNLDPKSVTSATMEDDDD